MWKVKGKHFRCLVLDIKHDTGIQLFRERETEGEGEGERGKGERGGERERERERDRETGGVWMNPVISS